MSKTKAKTNSKPRKARKINNDNKVKCAHCPAMRNATIINKNHNENCLQKDKLSQAEYLAKIKKPIIGPTKVRLQIVNYHLESVINTLNNHNVNFFISDKKIPGYTLIYAESRGQTVGRVLTMHVMDTLMGYSDIYV